MLIFQLNLLCNMRGYFYYEYNKNFTSLMLGTLALMLNLGMVAASFMSLYFLYKRFVDHNAMHLKYDFIRHCLLLED